MGGPGCGLSSAAFCDTFDHPSLTTGRAGELNPAWWSGGRNQPQLPTGSGMAFPIGAATLSNCRSGLPAKVFPDQDTLVCDPNADVNSNHLLVLAAAQNYGMNSYRIRQPFDFAGRTGKIVFDADGTNHALLGWVSLEVTEDPIAVPSFSVATNEEGGIIPKNGFELQFVNTCGGGPLVNFSLGSLQVFENYVDTLTWADWQSSNPAPCMAVQKGKLNHFEVTVAQEKIEVYATPFSPDGTTFVAPQLIFSANVKLPFSRGYVHISTHNHATLKYSDGHSMDAWTTRWDNVGFDGPIIANQREYEIPDALVAAQGTQVVMNIGYRVADLAAGPAQTLHFKAVTLSDATSAQLSLSAWYNNAPGIDNYVLHYRFNQGPWHDHPLDAGEKTSITAPSVIPHSSTTEPGQGGVAHVFDVSLSELLDGDNSLELVTSNVSPGYPTGALNIDLIAKTR
jgi:hypothetical protein